MPDDAIEKRRQANRESYQRNREKRLEKNRQWRAANPERMKELNRKWYTENHARALADRKKYREAHPEKMRLLLRKWYAENKEKVAGTTRLQRTGCTVEKYQELLLKQNGLCAICQQPPDKSSLAADHCHTTGDIRGLLCFHCNTMLGMARDNEDTLLAGIEYLKQHRSTRTG